MIFLAGCQPQTSTGPWHDPTDVVLVEVDGAPVTLPMLEYLIEARGVDPQDATAVEETLEELIRLQVVANEARATGVAAMPRRRAERLLRELEALQLAYFDSVYQRQPITDAEIEALYQEQLARSGDYQYRLETVTIADQADAVEVLVQLSDDPSQMDAWFEDAGNGEGEVSTTDWIDRSQVPPRLTDELNQAEIGQVLSLPLPVPAQNGGWLIARVVDRREFEPPALEMVREGIARTLVRQRINAEVDALYAQANIVPRSSEGQAQ